MLKEKGIILRIGAFFASEELGFKSILVAMKVPHSLFQKVARIVNQYPGVTHNYGRDHALNLWFVLIEKSDEEIERILKEIKDQTSIDDVLRLPKTKLFKLNLNFTREEGMRYDEKT